MLEADEGAPMRSALLCRVGRDGMFTKEEALGL